MSYLLAFNLEHLDPVARRNFKPPYKLSEHCVVIHKNLYRVEKLDLGTIRKILRESRLHNYYLFEDGEKGSNWLFVFMSSLFRRGATGKDILLRRINRRILTQLHRFVEEYEAKYITENVYLFRDHPDKLLDYIDNLYPEFSGEWREIGFTPSRVAREYRYELIKVKVLDKL